MTDPSLPLPATTGLRSFWMAGFEAASHINRFGNRIDMIGGTHHDRFAQQDYQMLKAMGLGMVRDALRWHLIDRGVGSLDFSSFLPVLKAAVSTGSQVIWSLHHYGFPDDLSPLSAGFINRFVRLATEAARIVRDHSDEIPYYTPVNEISFFTWAGSRGIMYPFAEGRDEDLKRQLVLASIEACHAIRSVDSRSRFVFTDPIIHVVAPPGEPELAMTALRLNESQFAAWDMIAGRRAPELGGQADLLDILGMNFYHTNEWELGSAALDWAATPRDPRWKPLRSLMEDVWVRYRRPLFLAETSHIGVGRAEWITEVASEVLAARKMGVPVEGICLFPIIDRYDWENPNHWHNSGLWDLLWENNSWSRVLNLPYAQALENARHTLA